ncbi:hypothetical protein ACF0H5_009734 [Mactra antiquata]
MAIDLRKNKDALLKAYNEVVTDNNDIDWAVFTYEGQTCTLKVSDTGEGSIGDLVDELNSSKIMYAYCKVMDPNTSLPKYVLINWQGEAAPESMKFKCANHLRDVVHFFKGVHVTINARTEDDVDEDDILKKVAKSSGSQYSIHKEKPKPKEDIAPVASVYQKTQASRDINIKERDKFWAQTETEEQKRIAAEKKVLLERQQSIDSERKAREAKEQEMRDKQVQERMKMVSQQKAAERRASQTDDSEEKKQWEKEQELAYKEEEERRLEAEKIRKQRALEAEKLASGQTSNARSFFKRKESQTDDNEPVNRGPPPPRKLKHNFGAVNQEEAPARKAPIQLPREPSPPPSQPYREPSPPPTQQYREPSPPPREPSPPPREPSPQPAREPSPPPMNVAPPSQPATRNLLAESLPQRQRDSDEEENDDEDWGEDENANIPAVHAQHIPEPEPAMEEPPMEEPASPQQQQAPDAQQSGCVNAVALYDYQAADETEITFDPDDVISDIDRIDEGWWVGTAPDGSRGMFPANYVEIM